MDGSEVNDLVN